MGIGNGAFLVRRSSTPSEITVLHTSSDVEPSLLGCSPIRLHGANSSGASSALRTASRAGLISVSPDHDVFGHDLTGHLAAKPRCVEPSLLGCSPIRVHGRTAAEKAPLYVDSPPRQEGKKIPAVGKPACGFKQGQQLNSLAVADLGCW